MPKLIIDSKMIEVPEGTKVIEAAERLGIMIPRFCYHPALGSVGACRVCAVMFVEGPVKGIQMSCMIDARDGMVVSTTDEEAVDFRRHVIEWLMLNHPHDCPVCDEGGHCLLQDMTVAGGHGRRRYAGPKRTYIDQDLGPLVQHEMNRCIHCYRCSRYYQEYSGYTDLGVLQIGNRTYFGRYREGTLQSPFTGNLSDICPTGVYTDKPSRYKGRRWDYERSAAICKHCSLGCHLTVSARYREIVRHEARYSAAVNGHFICDRGRFGFYYAEDPRRPRAACVDQVETPMPEALDAARARLQAVAAAHGPAAIALAAGTGSPLETLYAALRLCRDSGWAAPAFFPQAAAAERIKRAAARLEGHLAVSLAEVAQADFILVVGGDPVNEAPMLAMALRQAWRGGAAIGVIDPRPVALPFAFAHLPVPPHELDLCLGAWIKTGLDGLGRERLEQREAGYYQHLPGLDDCPEAYRPQITDWAQALKGSQRPLIVCGSEAVSAKTAALAADGCLLLRALDRAAGLFHILPEANSYGAALLGGGDFDQLLSGIEEGPIKALILVEWDPLQQHPQRQRVLSALSKLELLIVLDHTATRASGQAHLLLPTATIYEAGGLFINQEGRLQRSWPAYRGGLSVAQTGGGDHPPRIFSNMIPGADPRPAWELLAQLGPDQTAADKLMEELLAVLELSASGQISDEGIRIHSATDAAQRFQQPAWSAAGVSASGFSLQSAAWTFGTEPLAALSPPLQQVETAPYLMMHRADGVEAGITDGDQVVGWADGQDLTVVVKLFDNMARRVIVIPRHRRLDWQVLEPGIVDPIDARLIFKRSERP